MCTSLLVPTAKSSSRSCAGPTMSPSRITWTSSMPTPSSSAQQQGQVCAGPVHQAEWWAHQADRGSGADQRDEREVGCAEGGSDPEV